MKTTSANPTRYPSTPSPSLHSPPFSFWVYVIAPVAFLEKLENRQVLTPAGPSRCPICLSDVLPEEAFTVNCDEQHVFCLDCLYEHCSVQVWILYVYLCGRVLRPVLVLVCSYSSIHPSISNLFSVFCLQQLHLLSDR